MGDLSLIEALVKQERDLHVQISKLEADKSDIRSMLMDELRAAGLEKTVAAGCNVAVVKPKPSERLDKALLIQAGVMPEQLQKGTVVTPRKEYVSIRAVPANGE